MISNKNEFLENICNPQLTPEQKLINLGNVAERFFDPIELLGYTEEEFEFQKKDMICDLNEGFAIYRPRYVVPDYQVFVEKGCDFLSLNKPEDLDDLLDGLLILYSHVPSITSFPVFIGHLDSLIDPFLTDNENSDYKKIKRFLNHIDKTITDSFCHADIGPKDTKAGRLILRAIIELENPTPNMSIKYDPELTSVEFTKKAADACLRVSKPSFANHKMYSNDLGNYAMCSCYNALPQQGGAHTLLRLRLKTIAKECNTFEEYLKLVKKVSKAMLSMMDKRITFLLEKSNFFESSFLEKEGFISKDNFTAMFGLVGLADAVNYFLEKDGLTETFGQSKQGDKYATEILDLINNEVENHIGVGVSRTNNHYLMHAQVGANLSEEDKENTPAHRIKVGQEPEIADQIVQSAPFHKYFTSGTGDLYAFDQTYLDHLDSVKKIIDGSFNLGYRYITTYLKNTDLIRVTGYLVKKSEVEKLRNDGLALRDTAWFGMGNDDCNQVFDRKLRK